MDQLPCYIIVYRTITRKSDVWDNGPSAFAFHRRPPHPNTGDLRDPNGLSLNYNVEVPEGCAPGHSGKQLIVSLHVGRIRDIHTDLDVIADSKDHANIVGIPRQEADPEKLEQFAAALVIQSRVVWS